MNVTARVHARLAESLKPGDIVVDATAGNGHDTLALAGQVGPTGEVYAIDLQPAALASTHARLTAAGLADRCRLIEGDHADMGRLLPATLTGKVAAIVFNLGYLPGGDHNLTTRNTSTLRALAASLDLLRPGGVLSVVCYPGHPEGALEADAVERWAAELPPSAASVEVEKPPATRRPAPFLIWIVRHTP